MSTQPDQQLTVDDLDLFPGDGNRYELIERELFVSRVPRLTNIIAFVRPFLDRNPIGFGCPVADILSI